MVVANLLGRDWEQSQPGTKRPVVKCERVRKGGKKGQIKNCKTVENPERTKGKDTMCAGSQNDQETVTKKKNAKNAKKQGAERRGNLYNQKKKGHGNQLG